jgi:hypothetical protein
MFATPGQAAKVAPFAAGNEGVVRKSRHVELQHEASAHDYFGLRSASPRGDFAKSNYMISK